MAVVLVLACLAVLAAVVVLAMGRGGELSPARRDLPPLPPYEDRPFTGPEPFALPRGFWGYQVERTDEAIGRLRRAVYERDARMAALELRIGELERRLHETHDSRHELEDTLQDSQEDTVDDAPEPPPWTPTDEGRVDLVKHHVSAADRIKGDGSRS
ncbi:hypothetical protein Acsp03_44800 [Actinomadura sp. NBRC 104412]|uniref:hypothetical protein n=1 Tax=Actinomadura sp. NBRC 104412 TaxID=3032203 RepID=UPI0024A49D42|nr:hypothetical protein [Actinomadura sp. NBRC 104412]GLZ07014.1 hypothetical protein Acsp03_44800 [Actinomadura sp. NBRC 104412]